MEYSAKQIADFLKGCVKGNPDVTVHRFAPIEKGEEGAISFLSNPKYNHFLYETQSSIVLVNKDLILEKEVNTTLVMVDNAYESLAMLLGLVESQKPKKIGISPLAFISPSAKIGKNVYIAPFVFIGENAEIGEGASIDANSYIGDNAKIGDDTCLHASVKVERDCIVGEDCIIHAGVVIGSDGFGFAPTTEGYYRKIPQVGNVVIEDNVEIGANTTIDRATLGSTRIGMGVKLDNLVQIAHNVEVKKNTVIAAQSGVAGSSTVGENCILGGQVGVAGHLRIANRTSFGAKTGVQKSIVKEGTAMQGYPGISFANFQRSTIVFKQLPELQKMIYDLQQQVDELKKNQNK